LKGICEICGKPAVARCRLCGREVCEEHYDRSTGLCTICLNTRCEICKERLAVGRCIICGRLVCDKCSVQLDNVRRICVHCLNNLFNGDINLARKIILKEKRFLKIPEAPRRVTLKVLGNGEFK